MDMIKICVLAVSAVVLISILKQYNQTYAVMASVVAVVAIILYSISVITPVIQYITQLGQLSEIADFGCVIKAIGLGILAQTSSDICVESGQNALANKVVLVGKISIMFVCMPLFKMLLDIIKQMLI